MARSTYIYVAAFNPRYHVREFKALEAAFTVKHELVSWLHKLTEDEIRDTLVHRLRDNAPGQPVVTLDVKELLEQ